MRNLRPFTICISLLLLAACVKDVSIVMVAPPSLATATVLVDDKTAAHFERYGEGNGHSKALEQRGASARFTMDVGTRTVKIVSRASTISFRLRYETPTEDHLVLDEVTIAKLQVLSASPPPFLEDVE